MKMSNFVKKVYDNFVKNNFINHDQKQIELIKKIELIWSKNKKINFFFKQKKINGIYLYGSVGIGKTFILNLFVQGNNKAKKIHFNNFMISVHAYINNNSKEFALETYIKNLSKNINLIFIDELHIFNIVDALLIKKIFLFLHKYKVFILISSNFQPNELYKNGLQRDDFLPFIDFLDKTFEVLHLKNMRDYRREMLNQSKTYFTPINNETSAEFKKLFDRFVDQSEVHIRKIKTRSRVIRFEKSTSNIVFCSFKELCMKNLAHEDYYNIAKAFNLIFISNIPSFMDSNADQCRRFISLIDMLYNESCSVIILAEKPINQLCKINNLNQEFKRTASRLYEMTIINKKNNE